MRWSGDRSRAASSSANAGCSVSPLTQQHVAEPGVQVGSPREVPSRLRQDLKGLVVFLGVLQQSDLGGPGPTGLWGFTARARSARAPSDTPAVHRKPGRAGQWVFAIWIERQTSRAPRRLP